MKVHHALQVAVSSTGKTGSQLTPQYGQTHSNNSLLPKNYLSVFDHFVGLAIKGLTESLFSLFRKFGKYTQMNNYKSN